MEEQNILSRVYAFESEARSDIAVKRAKQQFAADLGLDYRDVLGQKIQRIPAYGIRVFVCYEPQLFEDERP